jgi:hypothetical protein
MTVETFLPCFPGFYGTNFEFNDEDQELEYINEKRAENGLSTVGYDDVKWSYSEYHRNVSKKAVNYIETELGKLAQFCKLKYERLQSPREYNFETDMVIIVADFEAEEIRELLFDCPKESIAEFLAQFLPRDGFSPFDSTMKKASVEYWMETDFNNFQDFGLAAELILKSHPETEFNEDDFAFESKHDVEVGIDNYNELVP